MALTKVARRRLTEVPIGTILAHDNFGGLVSFDTNIFKFCDGTQIVDALSPLNGLFTRDMSGRYLVGFGSDTVAASMDTAGALGEVGQVGHLQAFAHLHSIDPPVTTSSGASTDTVSISDPGHQHYTTNHSHGLGSACALIGRSDLTQTLVWISRATPSQNNVYSSNASAITGFETRGLNSGTALDGTTDPSGTLYTNTLTTGISASHAHTHTVNIAAFNSAAASWGAGSDSRSIQPRSQQVRFIIRIK